MTWTAALDDLEVHLSWQRSQLGRGQLNELPVWTVPYGLGTMPPALERRARQLLAESVAIETALRDGLDQLARRLHALGDDGRSSPVPRTIGSVGSVHISGRIVSTIDGDL